MPVKNKNRKPRALPRYFKMPDVSVGDPVEMDTNQHWRESVPAIVTRVYGNNTVDLLALIPKYGQVVFEGAVHREDPIVEQFPERFEGNEAAVWQLAPQATRVYDLMRQVMELERRLALLEARPAPFSPSPPSFDASQAPREELLTC